MIKLLARAAGLVEGFEPSAIEEGRDPYPSNVSIALRFQPITGTDDCRFYSASPTRNR